MRSMISSGIETRRSFFMNSALRRLVSGQMPAITGMRKLSMRLRKSSSRRRSKTGWVMAYSAPASTLYCEAAQFVLDVGHAGIGRDADGEVGAGADGIGADVEAVIQALHDVDQADGVDIEHRGGIRIVAQLGRIAGEAENVVAARSRMRPAGRTGC